MQLANDTTLTFHTCVQEHSAQKLPGSFISSSNYNAEISAEFIIQINQVHSNVDIFPLYLQFSDVPYAHSNSLLCRAENLQLYTFATCSYICDHRILTLCNAITCLAWGYYTLRGDLSMIRYEVHLSI